MEYLLDIQFLPGGIKNREGPRKALPGYRYTKGLERESL